MAKNADNTQKNAAPSQDTRVRNVERLRRFAQRQQEALSQERFEDRFDQRLGETITLARGGRPESG